MAADAIARLERRAQKAKATSMRRHVLVCTDDDCDEERTVVKRMRKRVAAAGLRDTVTVTKVDCLDICKLGPICVVYPEGAWYHSVTKRAADRIVDEHLADGEPVTEQMFLRNELR